MSSAPFSRMDKSMFPTPQDTAVHKNAVSRIRKTELELSQRASAVSNPDELVKLILEIARKRYRQGQSIINLAVLVPVDNFAEWAISTKNASDDMDMLDRTHIRKEITRIIRRSLKLQLQQGIRLEVDSGYGYVTEPRLTFNVRITIPKRPRTLPPVE